VFRKQRLYEEDTDQLLRRHLTALKQLFDFYKVFGTTRVIGAIKGKHQMAQSEWANFCKDAQIVSAW
jgi:hypothetical protein